MSGFRVTVIDSASPLLAVAIKALPDFRRPLINCGQHMYRSFVRQFQAEGIPPWLPITDQTFLRRRKVRDYLRARAAGRAPRHKGSLAKILQDSGRLRRSYISRAADKNIYVLEPARLTIGSNVEYAAIHQYGGWTGRDGATWIPSRPLNILDSDREEFVRIFREHVKRSFGK